MKINSTLSATYDYLRFSIINRRFTPIIATLDCGAQIIVKLPRLNDTTRRLKVGFRKNKFSTLVHWTGTASAFASDDASTREQLKYVVAAVTAFKTIVNHAA